MIIQRLYELAERENLLDDPAFETLSVPFVIQIGDHGQYLGMLDQRDEILIPSKKKGGDPKTRPGRGKELPVPKAHGNTANRGFARYFCDTLARVLPITDDEKSANSRQTFWQQQERTAAETADPAMGAIVKFGDQLATDQELINRVRADVKSLKPAAGDRCTFAWQPDGGASILVREPVRAWYRQFFAKVSGDRAEAGSQGFCQVTGQYGPLPTSHTAKLGGVPGGIASGISLVSCDKEAFESYGLDKAVNAAIGYRAAEGYTRALTALLVNKLPGRPRTSFRMGKVVLVFWTREPTDTIDPSLLFDPTPDTVAHLLESVSKGRRSYAIGDPRDFYCLSLSGNAARAIVRGYLEQPVGSALANLARWFADLAMVDVFTREVSSAFPLWQLALATAPDSDHLAPDGITRLFFCALAGEPLPYSILAGCLQRLTAEGATGFRTARLGLMKLILIRKEIPVTEQLDSEERRPAYVYGRLLALLEQIQYQALGDANANIVDKVYGTFSTAPGLVFGRVLANARNHLRKIHDGSRSAGVALEKRLGEIVCLLPPAAPARHLSLSDQARFALGYYHQKAHQFEQAAQRKAAKAAVAGSSEAEAAIPIPFLNR